ncbi:MAG: ATP-binding cassette domain-containing protein [Alphaproteobacteria bacterium]|nr:ATP-binding cassette domain-containing protein [Alphaproteobacteria bacterium]
MFPTIHAGVAMSVLLDVTNLSVHFPLRSLALWGGARHVAHAVDGVSLTLAPGETLGLVGESGSGKTTLGRAILRRAPITAGTVRFRGEDITTLSGEPLRRLRRNMQLVFQDPYASLNPRLRVRDIVGEPLEVHGIADRDAIRERVSRLLTLVGLPADAGERFPHAFSGGQRQRIGLARALALEPELIIADEPVSALDVSIRAQVVNLMQDLQARLGLSYLFIAHDLSVVKHLSHRVAIMYAGKIVEIGDRRSVYERPMHPYTEALLAAVPVPDPAVERHRQRAPLSGEPPSPVDPKPGCRFASRCPLVRDVCRETQPPLVEKRPSHSVACWLRE